VDTYTRDAPKLKFIGLFDSVRYTAENKILRGLGMGFLEGAMKLAVNKVDADPEKGTHDLSWLKKFEKVRHALAMNEERTPFTPVRFSLADLQAVQDGQTFVEAWFVGTHLDIGGSATHDGLSIYPLQWMLQENAKCGLRLGHKPQREIARGMIEDPIKSAFPLGLDGEFWTFLYNNGISCAMQDVRKVHQAATLAPGSTTMDHRIHVNYASIWDGNIEFLNSPRQIFNKTISTSTQDGKILQGYIGSGK
jgi:hypothetical protein